MNEKNEQNDELFDVYYYHLFIFMSRQGVCVDVIQKFQRQEFFFQPHSNVLCVYDIHTHREREHLSSSFPFSFIFLFIFFVIRTILSKYRCSLYLFSYQILVDRKYSAEIEFEWQCVNTQQHQEQKKNFHCCNDVLEVFPFLITQYSIFFCYFLSLYVSVCVCVVKWNL